MVYLTVQSLDLNLQFVLVVLSESYLVFLVSNLIFKLLNLQSK